MTVVVADYYPRTISQYVPNMEFAADVVGGIALCNFGAPAALDADGIWDGIAAEATAATFTSADFKTTFDGSSTSLTSTVGMMDAPWGRCLTLVGTAGSDHVCTVTGRDYLGQIMTEAFTLSGTVVQYGEKAFKFVDSILVAAGAASDTLDVGWSDVLGLPYASLQILSWSEDNVTKGARRQVMTNNQVITHASDASEFGIMSPVNGYVSGAVGTSTTANTTAASAISFELATVAIAGLALTIPSTDSIGDGYADTAVTWDQGATSRIAQGASVEIVSDTGGTAGVAHFAALIDENVLFVDADTTTATTTTSDTRGLVRPYTLCDGSIEFEGRFEVNTSNLHGIVQA
jgi:hypothetical protein